MSEEFMKIDDKIIVRDLAKRILEISQDNIQLVNANKWTRVNDLITTEPTILVWSEELPWDEIHSSDLELLCEDPFLREQEQKMRRKIYMWKHIDYEI